MYITKDVVNSCGITATHHKIKALHIYYDQGVSHIDVGEYTSETACLNCSAVSAVTIEQIEVNQTQFSSETEIYNAILNNSIFAGGTLVQETN